MCICRSTATPRRYPSIRQIADAGADGLFSFEGPHDVLFPLLVAARESELALMTNVAIAGPRSAVHLAHAAYDLRVYAGPVPGSDWAPDPPASRSVTAQRGSARSPDRRDRPRRQGGVRCGKATRR